MPGKSLDQRDFEHLRTEIESGKAPQGVQRIEGKSHSGAYYADINLIIGPSSEIETIQQWLISSLAAINNIPAHLVHDSFVRFCPRSYFDGPATVTFTPDNPTDQELVGKIQSAYARERKKYPSW